MREQLFVMHSSNPTYASLLFINNYAHTLIATGKHNDMNILFVLLLMPTLISMQGM